MYACIPYRSPTHYRSHPMPTRNAFTDEAARRLLLWGSRLIYCHRHDDARLGLKFFRTLYSRFITSNADGLNAWKILLRAAARSFRGWFKPPLPPNSSKVEERTEYRWRYLDEREEREGFLKSVEVDGVWTSGIAKITFQCTAHHTA